jgi:uncharacterized protein with HEPN domain
VRDTNERLRDIQEAIDRITKYTNKGRQAFDQDEVWEVVEGDLPVLKAAADVLLLRSTEDTAINGANSAS